MGSFGLAQAPLRLSFWGVGYSVEEKHDGIKNTMVLEQHIWVVVVVMVASRGTKRGVYMLVCGAMVESGEERGFDVDTYACSWRTLDAITLSGFSSLCKHLCSLSWLEALPWCSRNRFWCVSLRNHEREESPCWCVGVFFFCLVVGSRVTNE